MYFYFRKPMKKVDEVTSLGAQATVALWQAPEGEGTWKTLQSKIKPLDVAVSSSESTNVPQLNLETVSVQSTVATKCLVLMVCIAAEVSSTIAALLECWLNKSPPCCISFKISSQRLKWWFSCLLLFQNKQTNKQLHKPTWELTKAK